MAYGGMLYKSELDFTVELMETGNWGGMREFVQKHPEFARRRGGTISELLYRYACGTRDIGFRNLNVGQLGILLSLNKAGAQINRSRTLVSYVARFEPDKEDGGYFVEFPDLERTGITLVDFGDNLKEAEMNARRSLALYVAIYLETREDLVEPKYRIREGLKRIKQRRISVNLDDLVEAEAA